MKKLLAMILCRLHCSFHLHEALYGYDRNRKIAYIACFTCEKFYYYEGDKDESRGS